MVGTCVFCDKVLRSAGLQAHMATHTDERPFSCNQCSKSFKTNDQLGQHQISHSGVKHYNCIFCDKYLTTYKLFRDHIVLHIGETPYECVICQKRVPKQIRLINHLRGHTGERLYKCVNCCKTFVNDSGLKYHLARCTASSETFGDSKTQNKGKADKSVLCANSKIIKYLRRNHLNDNQGGNTQLPCSLCDKPFSSKRSLKTHMLVHTGEKPFKCNTCGKSFEEKFQVITHMYVAHKTNQSNKFFLQRATDMEAFTSVGSKFRNTTRRYWKQFLTHC